MKTMKVLDIHNGAFRWECIKQLDTEINPYRLYRLEWKDGSLHRKQIERYADFQSVLWHVWMASHSENC